MLCEDPDTAGTGNGAESDGETSKKEVPTGVAKIVRAQRAQSATS